MSYLLYCQCESCGENQTIRSDEANYDNTGLFTRICNYCETEMCDDCYHSHTCSGHKAITYQCLGCGQHFLFSKVIISKEQYCQRCFEKEETL